MANINNMKNQFLLIKQDIERNMFVKQYELAKENILKAGDLLNKIYKEEVNPSEKQKLKEISAQLKNLYKQCCDASGEEVEYEVGEKKVNSSNKPSTTKKNASPKKASKEEKNKDDFFSTLEKQGYSFTANNVDVKNFLNVESNEVVTFKDVYGMEDEKELITKEFFLDDEAKKFKQDVLGIENKNFILLYGVPGTGKTYFAKAISNEIKNINNGEEVYFFSVVCTNLKNAKVGSSENNVKAIFDFCKQFKHCVLFLDEFEAIAPDRKAENGDPTAGSTVTTLLQMMDGFNSGKGTLVIAATNCPYLLDGAVISRANIKIEIGLPTKELILATLQRKLQKYVSNDISIDELANRLMGYSNRDIKNLIATLKDSMLDKYLDLRKINPNVKLDDVKLTKEMIEYGLKKNPASTKKSDIDRINEFKERGE